MCPCSWEQLKNPSVLVCVLSVDTTTVPWAFGLRRLQVPGPFQDPMALSGMPYDHARNMACMRALEWSADYLFFLDSDVVPPRDAIHKLLARKLPLVGGRYCRRSPPHGVVVAIKNGQWVTKHKENALLDVDLLGAGCMLIRRDVLESLPPQRPGKHWFDWRVDLLGSKKPDGSEWQKPECLSEDFTFAIHAKQHGIPVYLDTSVKCHHLGFGEADLGTFVPMGSLPVP